MMRVHTNQKEMFAFPSLFFSLLLPLGGGGHNGKRKVHQHGGKNPSFSILGYTWGGRRRRGAITLERINAHNPPFVPSALP